VGILLGQQQKFSWASIAGAAVGAAVTEALSPALNANGTPVDPASAPMQSFAANFVGSMSGGLVRAALSGGKIDFASIAADAFGNALGNAIVSSIVEAEQQRRLAEAEAAAAEQRARAEAETQAAAMRLLEEQRRAAALQEYYDALDRQDAEEGARMREALRRADALQAYYDAADADDAAQGAAMRELQAAAERQRAIDRFWASLDWTSFGPQGPIRVVGPGLFVQDPAPPRMIEVPWNDPYTGFQMGTQLVPDPGPGSGRDPIGEYVVRMVTGAWNDPVGFAVGAGQEAVNVVPHTINGIASILHYSLSGYVYGGVMLGLVSPETGDAFYNYELPRVPHLEQTTDANQAGGLAFNVVTLALPILWWSLPGRAAVATGEVTALSDIARAPWQFPLAFEGGALGAQPMFRWVGFSGEGFAVTDSVVARTWQSYERGVIALYGPSVGRSEQAFWFLGENRFLGPFLPNSWVGPRYAERLVQLEGNTAAIEAKFIRGGWDYSLYNPESWRSIEEGGVTVLRSMNQALNYNAAHFPGGIIYHTNSVEFATHYTSVFERLGITNYQFVITPARRR